MLNHSTEQSRLLWTHCFVHGNGRGRCNRFECFFCCAGIRCGGPARRHQQRRRTKNADKGHISSAFSKAAGRQQRLAAAQPAPPPENQGAGLWLPGSGEQEREGRSVRGRGWREGCVGCLALRGHLPPRPAGSPCPLPRGREGRAPQRRGGRRPRQAELTGTRQTLSNRLRAF